MQVSLNFKRNNFFLIHIRKKVQMAKYNHDLTDSFAWDEAKLGI